MVKRLLWFFGVLLTIIGFVMPATAQVCGTSVRVAAGDTLWDIARECGTNVPAIVEANFGIFEPSQLEIGQTINIPTAEEARTPQVSIYPQSVRPGDRIQVIANGFPLTTTVRVGAGQDGSEILIAQDIETDEQGALFTTMTIPPTAELDGRWVVVVETIEGLSYQATSFAFFIDEETTQGTPPQPTVPPENIFTETQIYLIQLETGGSVGCGDSSVPFTVGIQPTVAPLTAAINQMLTLGEQPYGYYNALANRSFTLQGIDIAEGVAIISLTTSNDAMAGVCDAPRIEAQIRQTALQYATIDSVVILVNGLPYSEFASGR